VLSLLLCVWTQIYQTCLLCDLCCINTHDYFMRNINSCGYAQTWQSRLHILFLLCNNSAFLSAPTPIGSKHWTLYNQHMEHTLLKLPMRDCKECNTVRIYVTFVFNHRQMRNSVITSQCHNCWLKNPELIITNKLEIAHTNKTSIFSNVVKIFDKTVQ